MAAALPPVNACCNSCDGTVVTQVPGPTGPAGADGADGADGTDGLNAYTLTTAQFTMPAKGGGTVSVEVAESGWAVYGQVVVVGDPPAGTDYAYMRVTSIPDSTHLVLYNLETAGGAYALNAEPGTVFPVGTGVSPGGFQGLTGATGATGAAGANGTNGTNGANGADGADGVSGAIFSAKPTIAQVLVDNVVTQVVFGTEICDPDTVFAANVFTAPETALYFLQATASYHAYGASETFRGGYLWLMKNGAFGVGTVLQEILTDPVPAAHSTVHVGAVAHFMTCEVIVPLNMGDTVEVNIRLNDLGTGTLELYPAGTRFLGFKVGST